MGRGAPICEELTLGTATYFMSLFFLVHLACEMLHIGCHLHHHQQRTEMKPVELDYTSPKKRKRQDLLAVVAVAAGFAAFIWF